MYRRIIATGPSQSGKSLTGFVIPLMYHLFECNEKVICGLPMIDMATDKWLEDILPVIERSTYRDLLPKTGGSSRGGKSNLNRVMFLNGAMLRFMTGGSNDKGRAGATSRVVVITETDGFEKPSSTSLEAGPIKQLEARTQAYGDRARIYMECTVSVKEGTTWRELNNGTASKIAIKCPLCGHYVTPERQHFVGWHEAVDILDAGERASFACPECGALWSEADRHTANQSAVLVHKGQEVAPDGQVVGPHPRTDTLGFRWSAVNNLLVSSSHVGQREWRAARLSSEEEGEREMSQFVWAIPYEPEKIDLTVIDHHAIMNRVNLQYPRGHVPDDTQVLALGTDIGKWLCRWVVVAFRPHATPHVVDYGALEVQSASIETARAIVLALQEFRDGILKQGFESTTGRRHVQIGLIDARYFPEAAYQFCDETRSVLFPSMGFGSTQKNAKSFIRKARDQCIGIGEEYQVVKRSPTAPPGVVLEINVDHWKSWLHSRLQTNLTQPGAMTLFAPADASDKNVHLTFAKHMVAEKKVEEFVAGKGTVTKWVAVSRNNHFLDASVLACVAAHAIGARLIGVEKVSSVAQAPSTPPPAPPTHQIPRREASDFMPERPTGWTSR